jgi:hypothetical protein
VAKKQSKIIRLLREVMEDGPNERAFVEGFVLACEADWKRAQDVWEQTVEDYLETVAPGSSEQQALSDSEKVAIRVLNSLVRAGADFSRPRRA